MKIALVGDSHCIALDNPEPEKAQDRHHFRDTQESQRQLRQAIQDEAPDLVVSTGDMVDWCSPANIAYAKDLFDSFGVPWLVTPGNHDFSGADHHERSDARDLWQAQGVALHNRIIDADGLGLVLIDSHDSGVPADTGLWLDQISQQEQALVCVSHVPWKTPALETLILDRQPKRDLKKYVQSKAPEFYEQHVRGRFERCFFGHLHFCDACRLHGTDMQILPLSVRASDREYPEQGRIALLDSHSLQLRWRILGD